MLAVVKKMLSRYYAQEFSYEVPGLSKREIAVMYEGGKMLRHKHFDDLNKLKQYLSQYPPLNVYYSTAYYENPSAPTMEAKGWQGADVVFDIDTDKYECYRYYQCLSMGHYYASVIYDILKTELGVQPTVRFSGTRGFHIHVPELKHLDKNGRQKLLEYIFGRYKISEKYVKIGSAARAGRQLLPENAFDVQVLLDVHRVIRYPDTVHGKSGLRCLDLDINKSYDPHRIVEDASWAKGELKVYVKEAGQNPRDAVFTIDCTGACTLPAQVALYALLRNLAEPIRRN
ncbi:MAG: hypothetical protein ACPL4I_10820 [Bacteroidota bacterium]